MIKRILLTCIFTILAVGLSYSQTKRDAYLNIDYLKVDSENMASFEEMVTAKWKDVFAKEVGKDKITGCYLYKVVYPGGQLSDYNYVLVRTYKSIASIVEANESLKGQLASRKDNLKGLTLGLATHQYSELWKTEAGIFTKQSKELSKFMVMNYMRVVPGKELEYLALENDIARPLHIERLKQGMMHSWRTYSLLMPGGVGYDYNFATADYYDKIENIEFGFTNEIMKNVMPNANVTETLDAIINTREIEGLELWELLNSME